VLVSFSAQFRKKLFWPKTTETFDEFVINHKCYRNISTDSTESRYSTFI